MPTQAAIDFLNNKKSTKKQIVDQKTDSVAVATTFSLSDSEL